MKSSSFGWSAVRRDPTSERKEVHVSRGQVKRAVEAA